MPLSWSVTGMGGQFQVLVFIYRLEADLFNWGQHFGIVVTTYGINQKVIGSIPVIVNHNWVAAMSVLFYSSE